MHIQITAWRSLREPMGQRFNVTFARLFDRFRTPVTTCDKRALAGWSPATFANDYRNLANLERAHAIVLDPEGGATNFADSCEMWAEFWCFVHTTHSSVAGAHRLRVIFPTSRPVNGSDYRRCRGWLARNSNEQGQICDPNAADPSRLWFVPGIPPGAEYLCCENTGATLDVDAVLAEVPADNEQVRGAPVFPIASATAVVVARARRYLDACDAAISGNGGHRTTFNVAQKLVRGFRLDEDTALALLSEWNCRCQPPWSAKDLKRKVNQAAQFGRYPIGRLLDAKGRQSWG